MDDKMQFSLYFSIKDYIFVNYNIYSRPYKSYRQQRPEYYRQIFQVWVRHVQMTDKKIKTAELSARCFVQVGHFGGFFTKMPQVAPPSVLGDINSHERDVPNLIEKLSMVRTR
jgi:hypothetical protein